MPLAGLLSYALSRATCPVSCAVPLLYRPLYCPVSLVYYPCQLPVTNQILNLTHGTMTSGRDSRAGTSQGTVGECHTLEVVQNSTDARQSIAQPLSNKSYQQQLGTSHKTGRICHETELHRIRQQTSWVVQSSPRDTGGACQSPATIVTACTALCYIKLCNSSLPLLMESWSHSSSFCLWRVKTATPFPIFAILLSSSTGANKKVSNRKGGKWT